jgi:hypothetical protein
LWSRPIKRAIFSAVGYDAVMKELEKLIGFLNQWDVAGFSYTIAKRNDAILVCTSPPADSTERWEFLFFADGRIQAEAFKSVAVETGDRLDIVIMKLRERTELSPRGNDEA